MSPSGLKDRLLPLNRERRNRRLLSPLSKKRLELRLAGEHERTAIRKTELAERACLPVITGNLSWGTANGFLPDLEEMRPNTAAGVRMELPLFTGFAIRSEKRAALAMQRAAGAERLDTDQQIRQEVRQSLNSLRPAARTLPPQPCR